MIMTPRLARLLLPWFVIACMALMTIGISGMWRTLPPQPGIDLYQMWGIAKMERASGYRLGSPYKNQAAYQNQLLQTVTELGDRRLAFAVANRERLDVTGTPLLYFLMGNLPNAYSSTLYGYRAVQLAAFVVSVLILARPLGLGAITLSALIAALTACFAPLLFDLGVANVNCLQLLGLVHAADLLERARKGTLVFGRLHVAWLAALLTLMTLAKPNFAAATGLLGVYLLIHYRSYWILILGSGAMTGLFLVALSSALFRSSSVWLDWWNLAMSQGGVLAVPIESGNYSGIRLLVDALSISQFQALLCCGLLLLLPPLWAISSSMLVSGTRRSIRSIFGANGDGDPRLYLSVGVVLSLALSPLVWEHYQVLAVIPVFWLCREGTGALPIIGWLCLIAFADLPENINTFAGHVPTWLILVNHSFCWLPLWGAMIFSLPRAKPTPAGRPGA